MIQTSASITSTMAARTLSPNAFAAWLTMQRHTISMQMTTQDDSFPDFYAILGVSEEADEATIKKAFMRAILVNHPDKQAYMANDQERAAATQRTQALVHAKRVLFDAQQRTEYDKERNRRKNNAVPPTSTFSTSASISMAQAWEVWIRVVLDAFIHKCNSGTRSQNMFHVLCTILPPVLGEAKWGEMGLRVGVLITLAVNNPASSLMLRDLPSEEQRLFMDAMEAICKNVAP